MIRLCRLSIQFASKVSTGSVLLICLLWGGSSDAIGADKPGLSFTRLKEIVAHSIRTGAVEESPGKTTIEGDTLKVNDASIKEDPGNDAESPYVRVFLDQVEIEFRRQHLLRRQRSRQTIEPYFVKMEGIVAKKLALIEDSKLSDDDRNTRLGDLDEQMMKTYDEGMQAVAKSLGLAKAEFLVEGAATSHDVKLVASTGATIDLVRQTTAWLLKDAGKAETDYPWTSYEAGGTAQLIGAYYCRIRLNGKEATFSKKVVENTDRLVFPDP